MSHFLATIHLIVEADCESAAADGISETLRQLPGELIVDWGYRHISSGYCYPSEVQLSADYTEGAFYALLKDSLY